MPNYTRDQWRALCAFMYQSDDRPGINQIATWSDGTAVATNGSSLFAMRPHDALGFSTRRGDHQTLIPWRTAMEARKAFGRVGDVLDVQHERIVCRGVTIPRDFQRHDEAFPPYHRICERPKGKAAPLVAWDANLMATVMGAMAPLAAERNGLSIVHVHTAGALDPIHVETFSGGWHYLAIAMPCRVGYSPRPIGIPNSSAITSGITDSAQHRQLIGVPGRPSDGGSS